MRPPTISLLLLTLAACGHSDPYATGIKPTDGPLNPGQPLQLSFNAGQDLQPAWRPDRSGVAYTFDLPQTVAASGRVLVDHCLGVVPAGGGTRTAEKCYPGDLTHDSTDALRWPAYGPGGLVAWVQSQAVQGHVPPDRSEIRIGNLAVRDSGRIIRRLPYVASNGLVHATATNLAWLTRDTLVYLGRDVTYSATCFACNVDTLLPGGDIVLLDVTDPALTPVVVPGTTGANSVAAGTDGRTVYYTYPESSQVYSQTVDNGAISIVHDFGIGRVVRDAQVVGTRLIAVVDGRYGNRIVPPFTGLQEDFGGVLVQVDLNSGIESPLPNQGSNLYKRPALFTTGQGIVAEGYPFSLSSHIDPVTGVTVIDTTISPLADLWLVEE